MDVAAEPAVDLPGLAAARVAVPAFETIHQHVADGTGRMRVPGMQHWEGGGEVLCRGRREGARGMSVADCEWSMLE